MNITTITQIAAASTLPQAVAAPSGEQVVAAVEKNLNLEGWSADLKIEFSKEGGNPKVWTAHLYSWLEKGTSWKAAKFFGAKEDGTIIRKQGDQFSQKNGEMPYFPLGEEAAKVGVFGTDYSFKDVLELTKLSSDYDRAVFKEAKDDPSCYFVELRAKPGKTPFYHRRIMWVDKQTMVPKKMEVYGSSGVLLKTIEIKETRRFKGANYPVKMIVTSATRKTVTTITLSKLETMERTDKFGN